MSLTVAIRGSGIDHLIGLEILVNKTPETTLNESRFESVNRLTDKYNNDFGPPKMSFPLSLVLG